MKLQPFNLTHYSNSTESIKLTNEVTAPYLQNEHQNLNLPPTHKGLIILDVFIGQITDDIHAALNKNHICVVNVPAIMTHFYRHDS